MIILLIFSENSVSTIREEYVLLILFTFRDHVTLVMFRFLWNISFCFSNFSIVSFCFFAFTFWTLISCIMISYTLFRIFTESSIALVHCVWFFSSFLTFENARNSIRSSLSYRSRFSAFCWLLSCRRWAKPPALDLFVSLLLKHVFEVHLGDTASSP